MVMGFISSSAVQLLIASSTNRHSCALYKGLGGASVQSGQKQISSKFLGLFGSCRMSVLNLLF